MTVQPTASNPTPDLNSDLKALLRLSVHCRRGVEDPYAPSELIVLAVRLSELGARLHPAGHPPTDWSTPLHIALRLHLMDGRDDAELGRRDCRLTDYPTNDDWSEFAAILDSSVAMLIELLEFSGALAGDDSI